MSYRFVVAAASLLLPLASQSVAEPIPLPFAALGIEQCAEQSAKAGAEDVVYIEQKPSGGEGVALTTCAIVDAPPARVWPVLRDCERYQQFLPGVERSSLKTRHENIAICEALIDLPFPLGELRSVERATETELADGGFERRWSLESGTYRRMEGLWTLQPWRPDKQRTLVVYQLDMDPETVIPDFLLRRAQSSTAPKLFAAVRDRVRRCNLAASAGTCSDE
jgi:ribosome-associated toxin RatA of RatAB toxin-antitoxin module